MVQAEYDNGCALFHHNSSVHPAINNIFRVIFRNIPFPMKYT